MAITIDRHTLVHIHIILVARTRRDGCQGEVLQNVNRCTGFSSINGSLQSFELAVTYLGDIRANLHRELSITKVSGNVSLGAELCGYGRAEGTSAHSVGGCVLIGSVLLEEGNRVVTREGTARDVHGHSTIVVVGIGHRNGCTSHLSTVVVRIRVQILCARCMNGRAVLHVQHTALNGDASVTCNRCTTLHVDSGVAVECHACIIVTVDLTRDVDHVVHVAGDVVAQVAGNKHSTGCSVQCTGNVDHRTVAGLGSIRRAEQADAVGTRDGHVLGNRQHAVVLSACRCRAVHVQGLAALAVHRTVLHGQISALQVRAADQCLRAKVERHALSFQRKFKVATKRHIVKQGDGLTAGRRIERLLQRLILRIAYLGDILCGRDAGHYC